MTNSPAASDTSHDSGDEHNEDGSTTKTHAAKDRECQYCHQKFTSSSLGRHLDQFLSKKKPDGIHNVDEIRRLRGGITRRTARSGHKRDNDDTLSTQQSPSPQYTLPSYSELLTKTATTKDDIRFNRPHWQATGVITDTGSVNPPMVTVASPSISIPAVNPIAGQKRSFSTFAADVTSSTNNETVRALELSLREILDAVRVATKKAAPPARPFEFDFESQTFPYLCLALLPVPPTLFQSTPFATASSLPLSPPGHDQHQALRGSVSYLIDQWKWERLSHIQKSNPPGTSISEELDNLGDNVQAYLDTCMDHLDAAFQNFMSYGAESRHNLWTIELLRAFTTEQAKVKEVKVQVDRMTQEANQLQQQLDHLSMCQWPREMALWPPERPTFDKSTQDELRKINIFRDQYGGQKQTPAKPSDEESQNVLDRWDYERLVSKWRKHVREDRARRTGVQPSVQILQPGQPPPTTTVTPITGSAEVQSPTSTTASTPRLPFSLKLVAAHESPSNPTGHSRPNSSLAPANNQNSSNNSPSHAHTSSLSLNSSHPTMNGIAGTNGVEATIQPINHGGAPRRRTGILSDVEEYYGPRLAGFRRDR